VRPRTPSNSLLQDQFLMTHCDWTSSYPICIDRGVISDGNKALWLLRKPPCGPSLSGRPDLASAIKVEALGEETPVEHLVLLFWLLKLRQLQTLEVAIDLVADHADLHVVCRSIALPSKRCLFINYAPVQKSWPVPTHLLDRRLGWLIRRCFRRILRDRLVRVGCQGLIYLVRDSLA
jgi:hypothetical protein